MKYKSIFILTFSVLLLAAALFFTRSPRQSTIAPGKSNFRLEAGADIVRIEMLDHNKLKLVLEKDQNQVWWVNAEHKANEPAVRELISTLRNLSVRLPVPLSEKDSVNDRLDKEGLRVDVFELSYCIDLSPKIRLFKHFKRSKSFLTGANTPDGKSTYMRLLGSDVPFAVHVPGIEGGIGEIFSISELLWRDPVVVNLAPHQIKTIEVEFYDNSLESFVIDNGQGYPVLIQAGKTINSLRVNYTRVRRYLESFTELHYERLLTGLEERTRTVEMKTPHFLAIRITDVSGNEIVLHFFRRKLQAGTTQGLEAIGHTDPNRFFIQVNGQEFALAQYFVFSRIMRPFSHFVKDNAY